MAVDQVCIITLTGKKESPDLLDMKTEWKPVLDMKVETNNHPSVLSAFAGFIKILSEGSKIKRSTVKRG